MPENVTERTTLVINSFYKLDLVEKDVTTTSSTVGALNNQNTSTSSQADLYMTRMLGKYFEQSGAVQQSTSALENQIRKEIEGYFSLQINEDPKSFRCKNKALYPNFYKLAAMMYGVPATFSSSESNFPIAGYVNRHRSCQIRPDLIKAKLFMTTNS